MIAAFDVCVTVSLHRAALPSRFDLDWINERCPTNIGMQELIPAPLQFPYDYAP